MAYPSSRDKICGLFWFSFFLVQNGNIFLESIYTHIKVQPTTETWSKSSDSLFEFCRTLMET